MDKEKKEVKKVTKKTTTTKKTPAKKKAEPKKEVKTTTKKATSKAATTKTVKKAEEKKPVKKAVVKKSVKPKVVKNEEKIVEVKVKEKVPAKEQKVVTKVEEKKISSELLEIRKKRYIIEAIIIALVAIIVLLLLCNKTFLKTSYKTDSINVDIPRFSYYMGDKDNTVKLATLRKSDYLKEYYNEYLEGFIFYSCAEGNNTFYYNEDTKTLIKEIKVDKKFVVKTIEITYDARTPEEVCGLR